MDLDHPLSGKVPQVGNPIKFSETEISYDKAPPTLGQHTDEILEELGLTEEEIASFKQDGIIE